MKKILKRLFVFLFLFVGVMGSVSAATSKEISNVNKAPTLDKNTYKQVFITNVKNGKLEVVDTTNFEKKHWTQQEPAKDIMGEAVAFKSKPTVSGKEYSNVANVKYDKIGYYIGKDGSKVDVDAVITIDKVNVTLPAGQYTGSFDGQSIARIYNSGYFDLHTGNYHNASLNGDANGINFYPFVGASLGLKIDVSFKLIADDGNELPFDKVQLKWVFADIDQLDHSVANYTEKIYNGQFTESIKFVSGFADTFYLQTGSKLKKSESDTRYTGTTPTGDDGEPAMSLSTVSGYQTSPVAKFTWWGSGCGTGMVALTSDYPIIDKPVKSVEKEYYTKDENIEFTVKQLFPHTEASNKPKSIAMYDEFDKALDISKISYKVYDKSDKDVTSDWKISKDGNKVTLTYSGSDTSKVEGNYTFKFNNITVGNITEGYKTVVKDGSVYIEVPNKARTLITENDGTKIDMPSNEVVVKVLSSAIKLEKSVDKKVISNPKKGDKVTYKFVITNTGSAKLKDIKLTDVMEGLVINEKEIPAELEPGKSATVTGTYTLTEKDAGKTKVLENKAKVTGVDPNGNTVSDDDVAKVELIVNPNTGLISLPMIFLSVVVIGAFIYVKFLNKKNKFSRL